MPLPEDQAPYPGSPDQARAGRRPFSKELSEAPGQRPVTDPSLPDISGIAGRLPDTGWPRRETPQAAHAPFLPDSGGFRRIPNTPAIPRPQSGSRTVPNLPPSTRPNPRDLLTDAPTTPMPAAEANPIYSPILTRDEMSEISTRKVRIILPSEAARQARANLTESVSKKMRVDLTTTSTEESNADKAAPEKALHPALAAARPWYNALKKIAPVYVGIHLVLIIVSLLAVLYVNRDFSEARWPVSMLWTQWHHWDTGYYLQIALQGYPKLQIMAFYPLYPLLERGLMPLTNGNPFIAGLIISNLAELVMFTALYRLLEIDFGGERAFHTVLYFAIFPTAFFFSIVYTEATFLCFSVLTFYQIRRGRWWAVAIFGALASLTRPDGLFLTIPFCYEYLRRRWPAEVTSLQAFLRPGPIFKMIKSIRLDILFACCIPMGVFCMMFYGHEQFGDWLAFIHAHKFWNRFMALPGDNIYMSLQTIDRFGLLSFMGMRQLTDMLPDLLVGLLLLLGFIGKWRLAPRFWSYLLYGLTIFLYLQIFVKSGRFPLESMSRFVLEIFPAFIILASIRKSRLLHYAYILTALATYFFMASQFATGHWVL